MNDKRWDDNGVAEPNPEGRRIPPCQLGRLSTPEKDVRSRRWERRAAHGPAQIDVRDAATAWVLPRARGRRVAPTPGSCIGLETVHTCPPCDPGMRRPSGWAWSVIGH
jgi:hypothetical protein